MRFKILLLLTAVVLVVSAWFYFSSSWETTSISQKNASTAFNQKTQKANGQVVCLVYHRFGNDKYPSTNISTRLFKKHLKYLKQKGYTFLTFGEAAKKRSNHELDNGPYVVITVDDGYQSFRKGAMPLLKAFDVPATLFVNTKSVGDGSYLSWPALRQLRNNGIEIGNHSHAHPHFLNKPTPKARTESFRSDLTRSQQAFQKNLGFQPKVYAYPYGEFTQGMKGVLKKEQFLAAAGQHSGVWSAYNDRYAIPRFPMTGTYGRMERFRSKVSMHALPVKQVQPNSTIPKSDTPQLTLLLDTSSIQFKQVNCFIDGQADLCTTKGVLTERGYKLQVNPKKPLEGRRTKYTITAPGRKGNQWHWYSKLWVQIAIQEDH